MNIIDIYGFGSLRILYCYVLTKLFYRSARLIRFPFDIRGRRHISWGTGFTTGFNCRIEVYASAEANIVLSIGDNVKLNDNVHITAIEKVTIGNNVLMASKIYISDSSHGNYGGSQPQSNPEVAPDDRPLFSKPVVIEDNVWIGEFVSVLPGVNIGKGSIIGANSVVTRSIPAYSIAVGSPAKVIKSYNFKNQTWELTSND